MYKQRFGIAYVEEFCVFTWLCSETNKLHIHEDVKQTYKALFFFLCQYNFPNNFSKVIFINNHWWNHWNMCNMLWRIRQIEELCSHISPVSRAHEKFRYHILYKVSLKATWHIFNKSSSLYPIYRFLHFYNLCRFSIPVHERFSAFFFLVSDCVTVRNIRNITISFFKKMLGNRTLRRKNRKIKSFWRHNSIFNFNFLNKNVRLLRQYSHVELFCHSLFKTSGNYSIFKWGHFPDRKKNTFAINK